MHALMREVWMSAAVVVGIAGCQHTRDGAAVREEPGAKTWNGGPAIALLDSFRLRESDSFYVARPRYVAIDPDDGSLYISDSYRDRAIRIDRSGRPIASYGHRGIDSAALRSAGAVFVADSEVVIVDAVRNRLQRYTRRGGRYVASVSLSGPVGSITEGDRRVYLGVLAIGDSTSFALWSRDGDSLSYRGPVPQDYLQSAALARVYSSVLLDGWRDTLLIGFMGDDKFVLTDTSGRPIRWFTVPSAARRGVLADFVKKERHLSFPQIFSANSALFSLHRLPDGAIALVHYDQELDKAGNIHDTAYLSILDKSLSVACVDRHLPIGRDGQPQVAFRGDTLFSVEPRLDKDGSYTAISEYLVGTQGCHWIPLATGGPLAVGPSGTARRVRD